MNEQQKSLIQNIVRLLIEAGLCIEEEDEFYLTDVAVDALRKFPEGQHFLRLMIENGAVEIELKGVKNGS